MDNSLRERFWEQLEASIEGYSGAIERLLEIIESNPETLAALEELVLINDGPYGLSFGDDNLKLSVAHTAYVYRTPNEAIEEAKKVFESGLEALGETSWDYLDVSEGDPFKITSATVQAEYDDVETLVSNA